MSRPVAVVLLALLTACASVAEKEPQTTGSIPAEGPPNCDALHQPGTPAHKKCVDDLAAQRWGMGFLMGGTLVVFGAMALAAAVLSDENAKTDIVRVGTLDNGLPLYRFRYRWSDRQFVGVLAQEVQRVVPDAVVDGGDGYLRVRYAKLGIAPMTWEVWQSGGYIQRPLPPGLMAAALLLHRSP